MCYPYCYERNRKLTLNDDKWAILAKRLAHKRINESPTTTTTTTTTAIIITNYSVASSGAIQYIIEADLMLGCFSPDYLDSDDIKLKHYTHNTKHPNGQILLSVSWSLFNWKNWLFILIIILNIEYHPDRIILFAVHL